MLILAAAAFGAAACQEEVADVQGVVGDFAYIVDGTEAEYKSTTCYVYHTTTLGEVGEVKSTVTVALTKAQETAVDIVVDLDNASVKEGYHAFPEGTLEFNGKVTIPAGEMEASFEVTVPQTKFAQLPEVQYQAIFRIASASGVKVSTNSNADILYVITENIDPIANLLSVEESVTEYEIKNYPNETIITGAEAITKDIVINGIAEAFQAFDVTLSVDNSLVAAYNAANGTDYQAIPSEVKVNFTDPITMAEDAKSTNATITVENFSVVTDGVNTAYLTDERGYLIPVVIGVDPNEATIDETSKVTYIVVNPVNFETASNFFSALYLGDYRMATWYKFEKPMVFHPSADGNLGYTYIFHIYIDEVTNNARIGNFADANEDWINMLRFGQYGRKTTSLEWWVGPNGCRQGRNGSVNSSWRNNFRLEEPLVTPQLNPQTWYQIALVYDIDSYKMYVNCVLVAQVNLTDEEKAFLANKRCEFQMMEFNSSWGTGYRSGNEFHGRFSNFVVWNYALSTRRIKQCYGGVYNGSDDPRLDYMYQNDWGAFWAFNEGTGPVIKQTGGRPFGDIDFTNTQRCDDEVHTITGVDVSPYVQWKTDEANTWPAIEENAPQM